MKKRGQTRTRILVCAEELMQRCGFHGFSYHHIATRLGIRNAAVHYYFPSKSDLGVALVGRYRENFRFWTEHLASRGVSPTAALESFFELEGRYRDEGKVCPLGVVGVELPGIPEGMRESLQALLGEVRGWVAEELEAGRYSGEFTFVGPAEDRAASVLATLQGGLQLARLSGPEAFDRIVEQLRADLYTVQGASSSPRLAAG